MTNTILYKGRIDTTLSNDIILEYTENQDSAAYIAIFSEVGLGQGDYDIDNNKVANGRVYKYVGKNNGRYLPIVRLIPQEQKQINAFTTHYKLQKK